jgi:hypothetical protein
MAGIRSDCHWADLDCNQAVDVVDITTEALHWQATSGQWNYSLVYDNNRDGVVDIVDLQRVAAQWGWTAPE